MHNNVFRRIENRLLRGKALFDYEQTKGEKPQQTSLEIFMRRSYGIPERPDVDVERSVWGYRSRGKRLATV
ncbi:hypothetical protein HYU17_04230 [Candidatus Woesearchaeota archaeon]|nr:hypothetical protein [Candidatus Woesearchaeota archaeon]